MSLFGLTADNMIEILLKLAFAHDVSGEISVSSKRKDLRMIPPASSTSISAFEYGGFLRYYNSTPAGEKPSKHYCRLFINGWIFVPKSSTPWMKSSNVSSTPPVFGTSAISSSMRAMLA